MKDKLDGKIMTDFVGARPKTNSYQIDEDSGNKKTNGTKNCIIKQKPVSKL